MLQSPTFFVAKPLPFFLLRSQRTAYICGLASRPANMEIAQPKGISNRTLNKAAALLHLGQAVAVLCIVAYLDHRDEGSKRFFKGEFRLYKQVAAWHQGGNGTVANSNNYTITMESHDVGALDVRYAIFAFFLLSALFQGYASYWSDSEAAFQDLSSEYAVSASAALRWRPPWCRSTPWWRCSRSRSPPCCWGAWRLFWRTLGSLRRSST